MPTGPKRRSVRTQETTPSIEPVKVIHFTAPVIPGRSLIPGRTEPTFPAFFRAQVEPVTFRKVPWALRETIEEVYLLFAAKALAGGRSMAVLVPRHLGDDDLFWYGLTVIEHEDELYSFQRVVFARIEAVPKGVCDQGGIYEVPVARMSAWDGLTSEESGRRAA